VTASSAPGSSCQSDVAASAQRCRRLWIRLLESRIRRIDRKQNRLSKARTEAIIFATQHRRKLNG
jgi:hypothetical protein